jgi:cytochrome c oxidase subunit 2
MSQASSPTTAAPNAAAPGAAASGSAPTAAAPETEPRIEIDSFWLPRQASTIAPEMDYAWWLAYWISIPLFLVVVVPMAYFAFKYKRKSEDERTSPIDHNLKLEIFWSLVPTVLLIWIFAVGLKGYANASIPPNDAYEIQVTGQSFNWTFTYPDGTVTTELGVPTGRPVKLIMSSTDVIHSFFIPEFRVKQDVVPGQYTTLWFEATREIESAVQCTEYCGDGHSKMLTKVFSYPQPVFDQWLLNGGGLVELPPAQLGAKRYKALCTSCHSVDGTKIQGPSFKGLYGKQEKLQDGSTVTVDESYIRRSLLEPQAQIVDGYPPTMTPFPYLKDKDIEGIIAFIKEQK